MAKVALIKGNNRYQNISLALKEIEDEIEEKVRGAKRIVIKPNFVSTTIQLAATHVDTVRAVLDLLKPLTKEKITIAEAAALGTTDDGYRNFGYYQLGEKYNIEFKDLNSDDFKLIEVYGANLKPLKIKFSKTLLDSGFLVSLAIPKTHDTVVATLSLKNIAIGGVIGQPGRKPTGQKTNLRSFIHFDEEQKRKYVIFNLTMTKLIEARKPDLAVIDGFEAMEGDGPSNGDQVNWKIALASLDPLAADCLTAYLMGFKVSDIGYLYYCKEKGLGEGDLTKIKVVGNVDRDDVKTKFKPPPSYQQQLKWR